MHGINTNIKPTLLKSELKCVAWFGQTCGVEELFFFHGGISIPVHRDVDRLCHFNVFHFIVCYSDPAVLFDVVMVSPLMGLKGSRFYVSPPKVCFLSPDSVGGLVGQNKIIYSVRTTSVLEDKFSARL